MMTTETGLDPKKRAIEHFITWTLNNYPNNLAEGCRYLRESAIKCRTVGDRKRASVMKQAAQHLERHHLPTPTPKEN